MEDVGWGWRVRFRILEFVSDRDKSGPGDQVLVSIVDLMGLDGEGQTGRSPPICPSSLQRKVG